MHPFNEPIEVTPQDTVVTYSVRGQLGLAVYRGAEMIGSGVTPTHASEIADALNARERVLAAERRPLPPDVAERSPGDYFRDGIEPSILTVLRADHETGQHERQRNAACPECNR